MDSGQMQACAINCSKGDPTDLACGIGKNLQKVSLSEVKTTISTEKTSFHFDPLQLVYEYVVPCMLM
jgi:hypothetical protein